MPTAVSFETQRFKRLLQERIIPWVENRGIEYIFTAYPSWEMLKRRDPELPPGTTVTHKPILGERIAARAQLSYGKFNAEEYRWPQDRLLSARTPKLCFVTEGPIALQIADYLFHCSPGHGILLPPGTPNPDGTLSVLDAAREHHNACEMLMILPRRGSLSCWTSRQTYDAQGEMTRKSDTFSISQSLITPYLHQLVDETTRRQLHWEKICNSHLSTIAMLLQRELKELPVILGGDELSGEISGELDQRTHAITKAEEYISANLRWPLTIDQVARYVYMSRTAFTEQFRARTGKTFTEYLNDRRFDEACQLLKGTDLSIEQLSHQVGIQARSLRLLIRQRTGMSPTALRRHHRQQEK